MTEALAPAAAPTITDYLQLQDTAAKWRERANLLESQLRARPSWVVALVVAVVLAVVVGFIAYANGYASGAEDQCARLNEQAGIVVCGHT